MECVSNLQLLLSTTCVVLNVIFFLSSLECSEGSSHGVTWVCLYCLPVSRNANEWQISAVRDTWNDDEVQFLNTLCRVTPTSEVTFFFPPLLWRSSMTGLRTRSKCTTWGLEILRECVKQTSSSVWHMELWSFIDVFRCLDQTCTRWICTLRTGTVILIKEIE